MREKVKKVVTRTMKQFNKVIQIEVSLDQIANDLLATMDSSNPHAALIAETIIGTMHEDQSLGKLYSALAGKEIIINFQVGQTLHCTETFYNGNERIEVGVCTVKGINEYAKRYCVNVEYSYNNTNGKKVTTSQWVGVDKLEELVLVPLEAQDVVDIVETVENAINAS
jgi:hypothetical protein